MKTDLSALMASIQAGEDTGLELKEVVFRGNRMMLGGEERRPAARLAEVFASMANTDGGTVVLGVRDDGVPVGIDRDKRELVEQLVINAATENCRPMIAPKLYWEGLPGPDGAPSSAPNFASLSRSLSQKPKCTKRPTGGICNESAATADRFRRHDWRGC